MSESYTYSSKHFRVIIKKINNLYTFSIINQDTNEFFQSEQVELKQISSQTLSAAFNEKVKNITSKSQIKIDQIIYENKDYIKITIKVSLDYLPEFCQSILLKKVQKGEYQIQKIHYLQLQNQIKIVREELEWVVNAFANKKIMTFQKQSKTVQESIQLWELNLQKGDYLIQCCGMCLGQNVNYQYNQWGNESNYQSVFNYLPYSNFEFCVNLNKNCVYSINCKPFDYSSYEYPYSFSIFLHVDSQSTITINAKDVNNLAGTLNRNNLIVQKIKPQKE